MLRVYLCISMLLLSCLSFADDHPEIKRFCAWKANAARAIAMNRDVGLEEVEVISHYLNQESEYEEQKIVLALIEKIYGTYEFVTNDTIFSQTRETCVRDFYINTVEITASK